MLNSERLLNDLLEFSLWLDKNPESLKKDKIPRSGDSFLVYHLKLLKEEFVREKMEEYNKGYYDGAENVKLGTVID